MICPKCGNKLEEGIFFCSNCGNMVERETTDDPDMIREDAAAGIGDVSQEEQNRVMQAPQPPQSSEQNELSRYSYNQLAQGSSYQQDPQYQQGQQQYSQQGPQYSQGQQYPQAPQYAQSPVYTQAPHKKSKAPVVIGITAAIVIVLAAVILLFKPAIEMLINPSVQAKTALKNTTGTLLNAIDNSAYGSDLFSSAAINNSKKEFTYSFSIDRAIIDGSDMLKQMKADTLNIKMQVSPSDKTVSGTLGLGVNKSRNSEIEVNFYLDNNNMYWNIPALCSRSFYMDTDDLFDEMGIDYDMLFSNSSMSALGSSMSMYSGVTQAVIKDLFASLDNFIDELSYKKLGKITLTGDQGDVKATQFAIKVTEQNIKDLMVDFIDRVYNDDSLKPLLGLAMGSGQLNIKSLRKSLDSVDLGFGEFIINAAVNNKKQIVSVSFSTDSIAKYKGDKMEIGIKFVGKNDIYDCIGVDVVADDMSVNLMASADGGNSRLKIGIRPDQKIYKDEYMDMVLDFTVNESGSSKGNLVLNELSVKANIDGEDIDLKASGDFDYKNIGSISLKRSDFKNPVNMDRMSNHEEIEISAEIISKMSVLKSILSDEAYNELYKQLGEASTRRPYAAY